MPIDLTPKQLERQVIDIYLKNIPRKGISRHWQERLSLIVGGYVRGMKPYQTQTTLNAPRGLVEKVYRLCEKEKQRIEQKPKGNKNAS